MSELRLDQEMNPAGAANAASVGDKLRRAREARGDTVTDVGYALKLTTRQIEAMESDRFDLLPGRAFARGFLRNYARYLGLDAAALLAELDRSASAPAVELSPLSNADGVMPTGGGASRSAQGPAAVVAGLLLLAVAAGWFFDWFQMPEDDAAVVDAPLAEPEPTPVPAPSVPAPEDAAVPLAPPPAPADSTVPSAPESAAVPAAPAASPPATAAQPEGPPEASGVGHLVFRYEGESWVEVRDAKGKIIYSGTNAPGTSRTVQGEPPFALVVGNAPEVSLEYQGRPLDLAPHTKVGVARLTVQ